MGTAKFTIHIKDCTTPPTPAVLTLNLMAPGSVTAGNNITYTIILNVSGAVANNGNLSLTLPTGTTLAQAPVAPAGWTVTAPAVGQSGPVTFTNPSVNPAASPQTFMIVGKTSTSTPATVNAMATATAGNAATAVSNQVSTTVNPAPPTTLKVTKTCPPKAVRGGTITYTVDVANIGTANAINVKMADTLPQGTVLAAQPGTTCMGVAVGTTGTLVCSDSLLIFSGAPGGGTAVFSETVSVQTNASTPSPVMNQAVASADNAPQVSATCQTILVPPPGAAPLPGPTPNADDFGVSISGGDPFVAFSSDATNLVANDTNGARDVFVACVVGGTTSSCPTPSVTRASLASNGSQLSLGATGPPGQPNPTPISADGRFVVFVSSDPNAVTPATPSGIFQVYVRDTCVGASGCTPTTFLASAGPLGVAGNNISATASLSANGRVVAFRSFANNLVPLSSGVQIYARDTCFGAPASCTRGTILVSANNTGVPGSFPGSNNPSASGDGRFVAFESFSSNLVPTPLPPNSQQIFLRDTCLGAPAGCAPSTVLISANSTGSPSNSFSQSPSVSGDGRFVVFFSQSSDILPGNTAPGRPDVFLRDTCGGSGGPVAGCTPSTIRVSVALSGTQANGPSATGGAGTSISATGRFVAFGSLATNLLPTPSTPAQVYVLDTCFGAPAGCTRALHKVTVDSTGAEFGSSGQFSISGDGSFLAFTQLVGTAPNQIQQIFLTTTGFIP